MAAVLGLGRWWAPKRGVCVGIPDGAQVIDDGLPIAVGSGLAIEFEQGRELARRGGWKSGQARLESFRALGDEGDGRMDWMSPRRVASEG